MAGPLAISNSGTIGKTSSQTLRTLSINPTAVGNLIVFFGKVESTTSGNTLSAITGGNCTGWTRLITVTDQDTDQSSLWIAQATATGATNATVTTSATSGTWVDISYKQFTCTGVNANTQWLLDGTAASKQNTTSSTTEALPTLTPSAASRLYAGMAIGVQSTSASGQTAGYSVELDDVSNGFLYNTSVSTAQSPTAHTASSGKSTGLGVLIYAMNPAKNQFMPFFGL